MDYLDFVLHIAEENEHYRVTATSHIGRAEGLVCFNVAQLNIARNELLDLLTSQTRRGASILEKAQAFGHQLFASLPAEVRQHYARLRERAGKERGIRIKLHVNLAVLSHLPWEFLHDGQDFLVRSISSSVVRWPTHDVIQESLRTPVLRILVVIANPNDAPVPGVAEEKQRLQQALAHKNRIQVYFLDDRVDRVTLNNLQDELRRSQTQAQPYHILHFIGHGDFDEAKGVGYLLFEDELGKAQFVSDEQIKWLITDHPLHLVVLNSCESAQTAKTDALAGIATSLVYGEIPAVVAMQFPISGAAANAFAEEFYQAICDGFPVDAAVIEGRKAILRDLGEDSIEWGTPVLFTRFHDGRLIEVKIPDDTPDPLATTRMTITTLWSWLGAVLLYLSLNVLARLIWGRNAFLPPLDGFLNEFDPKAAAVLGILVGAPLLLAALYLNFRYLALAEGDTFFSKLPAAFNFDAKVAMAEGKAYRLILAVGFVALPFIVQLICLRIFLQGAPIIKSTGIEVSLWAFDLNTFLQMWYTDSGYRLYDTEFYLLVEPVLFIVLEVVCILCFIDLVWQLLRRKAACSRKTVRLPWLRLTMNQKERRRSRLKKNVPDVDVSNCARNRS